jgi:CO dehydrogenase nickel-insertion accessory protein CooC1
MENYLRSELEGHGLKALGVIRADPAIAMAWLTGSTLESKQALPEVQAVIDELERAVVYHG